VPYAFTPSQKAQVSFGLGHQWWGESPVGVKETIHRAKESQLKVMLKPQVWSHGWWTGDYSFESNEEWNRWEKDYEDYILFYASLADSMQADLFCIGTEFKNAINQRPEYWSALIAKIRDIYHGPLTYAANWDNFSAIPFWDQLDYIGINAYFPLSDEKTPSIRSLSKAWKAPIKEIRSCQSQYDIPVIFTEYGYLSVDGSAHNTWELEEKINTLDQNQAAQAIAIDALHQVFSSEAYWQGGFLWKWYPDMQGHEGNPDKDYTPQGKEAEKILARWFKPD
jgi:hypothetical protein